MTRRRYIKNHWFLGASAIIALFAVLILLGTFRTSTYQVSFGATTLSADGNNDCKVDGIDFSIWLTHYGQTISGGQNGDYSGDGTVDGIDFSIWLSQYGQVCPILTPTPGPLEIDISVCDPSNGPFSANITNPYLSFPVGMVNTLANDQEQVRVTSLNQTKVVNGITTRVVEEYETALGVLVEISRNYFAQAPDGTVCYLGEDVDIYIDGEVVSHDGAWLAGIGQNKAGILMPGSPQVGQTFWIEASPGIAQERGEVKFVGQSWTTPYSVFSDTVFIEENNGEEISHKYYARNVGMIDDDGMKLISRTGVSGTPVPTGTRTPTPTQTGTPTPTTGGATPTSILPPPGQLPVSEQIISFSSLPSHIQAIVNQRHPVRSIKEVKRETYSNGAVAYAIELIIDGHQWDMEILPDGRVIRDEYEITP